MAEEQFTYTDANSGEQGLFFADKKTTRTPGAPGAMPGGPPSAAPVQSGKQVGGPTAPVKAGSAPGGPPPAQRPPQAQAPPSSAPSGAARGGPSAPPPSAAPAYNPPPPSAQSYNPPPPSAQSYAPPPPASGSQYPGAQSYAPPPPAATQYQAPKAAPASYAPPSQASYGQPVKSEEQVLLGYFQAVDVDRSGFIDGAELTEALSKQGYAFKPETANLMIRMTDRTGSGKISWDDFKSLHLFIVNSQAAFAAADRDGSGVIDVNRELPGALQAAGFQTTSDVTRLVAMRLQQGMYGGRIIFPAFMDLCAFLGLARAVHGWWDTDRDGLVAVTVDQLMQIAIILKP